MGKGVNYKCIRHEFEKCCGLKKNYLSNNFERDMVTNFVKKETSQSVLCKQKSCFEC